MRNVLTRRTAIGLAAALGSAALLPSRARSAATSVTVAIQYGIGYLPVMIVDRLGLFVAHAKVADLDASITLTRMSGATAINDALISGSIDIGA